MLPPGHLGVAYLAYSLLTRARSNERPTAAATVVVIFGSQFPDLVDKPLSWHLGVLPTGRTLAHSLLLLVPLSVALYLLARHYDRGELGVAFAVGAISHVLVDALPAVWQGTKEAHFLLWPLLSVELYDETVSTSVIERLHEAYVANPELASMYFLAEFAILGTAVVLWRLDGCPGLEVVRRRRR